MVASYELMLKCWALDPEERPTPVDLVATLTPLDGPLLQDSTDHEVECESKQNGTSHMSEKIFLAQHCFTVVLLLCSFSYRWETRVNSHMSEQFSYASNQLKSVYVFSI